MKNYTPIAILLLLFIAGLPLMAQQSSYWDNVPSEIKEKNSFKRYEHFYRERAYPYDTVSIHTFKAELARERATDYSNRGFTTPWVNIGPKGIVSTWPEHWGTVSGRVRGLAVHPTNSNIVLAGAAAGGLWKSTNGGASWTDLLPDFSSLSYGAITFDPIQPNTVYAGTGEVIAGGYPLSFTGDGIYKSTDGGNSWTNLNGSFGSVTFINAIAVSPHQNANVVAAFGRGYSFFGSPANMGIWRSTDFGATWSKTLTGESFDVIADPAQAGRFYATIGGSSSPGVYVSTNYGGNWTLSSSGLPSSFTRGQITQSLSHPETLYVYLYGANIQNSRSYVFKSTNRGASWSQISAGVKLGGTYNGTTWSDQGNYDLCIAVSPTDPNRVLVGNIELHLTTNGQDFAPLRNPAGPYGGNSAWDCPMHVDLHRITFSPSDNVVYLGCDGGVYKSTNSGADWTHVNNGLTTIQYYRVVSNPAVVDMLGGGAQDNGVFITYDRGATPYTLASTGDGMDAFVDYSRPTTHFFFSTQNGYLMKTTDGGVTSVGISPTYPSDDSPFWTTPFWQHPTQPQTIYAASKKLWRSTNQGNSWTAISSYLDNQSIRSVSQHPVDPMFMAAVTGGFSASSPKCFVSTDGGASWANVTQNIPGATRQFSRVLLHPVWANTVFVLKTGLGTGKVFRSTDFGTTFTDISGNLPDVPVSDFFVDPLHPSIYFLGTDIGVYATFDAGVSWFRFGTNMPLVPVMDFSYYHNGSVRLLRAGTHGRGAFEIDLNLSTPVELTSFTAVNVVSGVKLKWTTASELNNNGFEVQRSLDGEGFLPVAFVKGKGTVTSVSTYEYTDIAPRGIVSYRLKQVDFDGTSSFSDVVTIESLNPQEFTLNQNFPNPFNPSTSITFSLGSQSKVKLNIVNALGEVVTELVNGVLSAGSHDAVWNAEAFPTGIYFAVLSAESAGKQPIHLVRKMAYLK